MVPPREIRAQLVLVEKIAMSRVISYGFSLNLLSWTLIMQWKSRLWNKVSF
jgi:hypothetical protein